MLILLMKGVAVSSDAGDFVCSFILATSLKYAELTAREKLKALRGKANDDDDVVAKKLEIPVMFVHVSFFLFFFFFFLSWVWGLSLTVSSPSPAAGTERRRY